MRSGHIVVGAPFSFGLGDYYFLVCMGILRRVFVLFYERGVYSIKAVAVAGALRVEGFAGVIFQM